MNRATNTVASSKGWSTLVRPKFGPGMLLQHEDLEELHGYTRELSRLLFRSFFGCGVVCGLVVKPGDKCGKWQVLVKAGLALNCSGDPIHVPKDQVVDIDPDCDPKPHTPLWVVLCRSVKSTAPRTAMCPSDDDETSSSCTRERDGYEIRVVKERPGCSCGCPPEDECGDDNGNGDGISPEHDSECWCVNPKDKCYEAHYLGECGCPCDNCAGGGCDCVLLARLDFTEDPRKWTADHRVRRFIRPVLIRDPQVQQEKEEREKSKKDNTSEVEPQILAAQEAPVEVPKVQPKSKRTRQPVTS
jgi:hypothetical protein